jgi:large subunit ribosomal protein L10
MTRAEKEAYVSELVTQLRTMKAAVFTEYRGTSVAQMEQLRRKLYEQGITYKVAKNSLVKRALDELGISVSDMAVLDQPVAIATSDQDEVMVAKAITAVNKEMETIIPVAGIVSGDFVPAGVIARLSKLPSREEMYAKVVGSLAGLPTKMVRTIANPMQGLVTALNQVKAQKES